MDGLLHQGEGHQEAPGGRVLGPGNRTLTSGQGTDRPHPGALGEGSVPHTLRPRAGITSPPVRQWTHVLLQARLP